MVNYEVHEVPVQQINHGSVTRSTDIGDLCSVEETSYPAGKCCSLVRRGLRQCLVFLTGINAS